MRFNLANIVVFGAGAILVYAAVKNLDPRKVVSSALQGKTATPETSAAAAATTTVTTDPPLLVPAVYPSV